jgi:hypothetical protein
MMTTDFATSNLSKISPKFRTSGAVSQPRRKAGSSLKDIGVTKTKVVKCTRQEDYIQRLFDAYNKTGDENLKRFIYQEIRKIEIKKIK